MELYFAPLEGITDALFRKIHHRCYPGADRYYTPFFSPTVHRSLTPREHRELPRVEKGDPLVIPQLLTKNAEDFLWAAGQCAERGYTEVNLNAGCPSGTVFSKGKGAGMLSDPDSLDRFLETVFASTPLPISVKARIGVADPAEFPALLAVFNRYPICRLILHPRVRKAFYTGSPDMERFSYAVSHSKAPLCYNGDVQALSQVEALQHTYPSLNACMIGRALVGNPSLLSGDRDVEKLRSFHDELFDGYLQLFGSPKNTMFRMKEHWNYLLPNFKGSEKLAKSLRKTTDLRQFRSITREIFQTLPFEPPE